MKPRQCGEEGRRAAVCLFVLGLKPRTSVMFLKCARGTQHMHTGQGLHAERCLKDALCAYGRGLGRAQWWL